MKYSKTRSKSRKYKRIQKKRTTRKTKKGGRRNLYRNTQNQNNIAIPVNNNSSIANYNSVISNNNNGYNNSLNTVTNSRKSQIKEYLDTLVDEIDANTSTDMDDNVREFIEFNIEGGEVQHVYANLNEFRQHFIARVGAESNQNEALQLAVYQLLTFFTNLSDGEKVYAYEHLIELGLVSDPLAKY